MRRCGRGRPGLSPIRASGARGVGSSVRIVLFLFLILYFSEALNAWAGRDPDDLRSVESWAVCVFLVTTVDYQSLFVCLSSSKPNHRPVRTQARLRACVAM
eukprot:7384936-Prymnesium_polylepis.1